MLIEVKLKLIKIKLIKIVKIVLKYKFQKTHDKNYIITITELKIPSSIYVCYYK